MTQSEREAAPQPGGVDPRIFSDALEWRCIGPYRGGRVVAVAGDPAEPMVFYFGACAGGVWKTLDGGTYWENISDGFFNTASVGAIAVAPSDSNIIYAGTGEACIRSDVSHGDGVYKSTDGGKTWQHVGLDDTRHIARVRIHPRNPDVVYVAALGHALGSNDQRGVFRTTDGGKTWERILFRSERAGSIDLSMDPNNPRVLYAAVWEALRTPWSLTSGGRDSSLYKTTNGGDSWKELSNNPGMPQGIKGRIGVAVSLARPDRVWAIVEAVDGALLRSDDGGATWERVSEDPIVRQRPFYHHHIYADPQDPETVWTLAIQAWKSTDGGRTFTMAPTPHSDNHDLWIDPLDPRRMIEGNDGGACVSFNGGATWSTIYNQPTSQFYHVATDTRHPYRVYGTQQNNTAISVPSRSHKRAIIWQDCYPVGSLESGYIAVRPDNPDIVYSGAIGSAPGGGGALLRYDHESGQVRIITVWPEISYGKGAKDMRYRFQWTYPIVISPHDPNVLYVAANRVFRSTDEGTTWETISPDLTRDDPTKGEPGGGPISRDVSGAEVYCTIFSLVESPHRPGVLWAGSDDGLIHISMDGGASWENVTPEGLPKWATVSMIEASPHDPATAYVAAHRYKLDDYPPYLYKTEDYGTTWESISGSIPGNEFMRVIRADPSRRGLLYAGTETKVYVSLDDGETWQTLQLNLRAAPIHDLLIKEKDLIAATHGRSFWVLDDLTPLHEITGQVLRQPFHLFRPRPTYRTPPLMMETPADRLGPGKNYHVALGVPAAFEDSKGPRGKTVRRFMDAGRNPPEGVVIVYYLRAKPESGVTLTFFDAMNRLVNSFSSMGSGGGESTDTTEEPRVPAEAGMNRFVWDMRYPGARRAQGDADEGLIEGPRLKGPLAKPGAYHVQLTVESPTRNQSFEIRKDPRVAATRTDLEAQFDLLIAIRNRLSDTHDAINELRSVRRQVHQWLARLKSHPGGQRVSGVGKTIVDSLDVAEQELIATWATTERGQMGRPPPRLVDALAGLTSVVASADSAPTTQSYEVFEHLSGRMGEQTERVRGVIDKDVPAFTQLIRELDIPLIASASSV